MAWDLDICGDEAIHMPENETCDECAAFAARLEVLEELLEGMGKVVLEKTDAAGNKVAVTVIGSAEHSAIELDDGGISGDPDPNDPSYNPGDNSGSYDIGPEDMGGGG